MASVFWDAHGIIFIEYLEKGRTITGAYYAALLDRLTNEIRKKRPHLKKKKSFFMMTMQHLTHRTLHRQKNMNWVSNRFCIHRILQTWPLTIVICSQTLFWKHAMKKIGYSCGNYIYTVVWLTVRCTVFCSWSNYFLVSVTAFADADQLYFTVRYAAN